LKLAETTRGVPDDRGQSHEDAVNSLQRDTGLAGGTDIHQARLGWSVERHEGG
jgi:hypothetical protein